MKTDLNLSYELHGIHKIYVLLDLHLSFLVMNSKSLIKHFIACDWELWIEDELEIAPTLDKAYWLHWLIHKKVGIRDCVSCDKHSGPREQQHQDRMYVFPKSVICSHDSANSLIFSHA
jgi:hypothetical protein